MKIQKCGVCTFFQEEQEGVAGYCLKDVNANIFNKARDNLMYTVMS